MEKRSKNTLLLLLLLLLLHLLLINIIIMELRCTEIVTREAIECNRYLPAAVWNELTATTTKLSDPRPGSPDRVKSLL